MREPDDALPYMPVFPSDCLAEVAELEATERGVYFSIRLGLWLKGGSVANDPQRLARMSGLDPERWDAVWRTVSHLFHVDGGQITHVRDTEEMARAREQREARRRGAASTNAQRSAQRPAQRPAQRALSGSDCDTPPSPSPSPSPNPESETLSRARDPNAKRDGAGALQPTPAFERCFKAFTNQTGERTAVEKWHATAADFLGGEAALEQAITARFEAGMLARHPYNAKPRYRPTFGTFLEQRNWEDPDPLPEEQKNGRDQASQGAA